MDDEGTFSTDLQNASPKEAIDFITVLKNKQCYVTNPRVSTRIKQGITNFQCHSGIIKNQSNLCRNAIESDTKHLPLFDMIMGNSYEHMRQSIQELTKQNLWKTAFKKFEVIWSA